MTSILTHIRNTAVPSEARIVAPVAIWPRLHRPDGSVREYTIDEIRDMQDRIRQRRTTGGSGPGAA